jgi:hypothetical protein
MGIEPTGDHGGGVHTRVIPVEKPLLGHHLWPFQLQILYSMGSRTRPGLNPRSSATAAATEAMRIAKRTISLRRRWRAQWRTPWRIIVKNSSSGPRRQLPLFFFISAKLLPALARSAMKSRTLVILRCVGGAAYYFLRFGLPERS